MYRMKYRAFSLLFAAAMVLALAGCGSTEEPEVSDYQEEEVQSFGVETTAAPREAAVISGSPEISAEEPETEEEVLQQAAGSITEANDAVDADLTVLAVKSILCSVYVDGLTYNSGDGVFFWRALGYFIAQVGTRSDAVTDAGDTYAVAASDIGAFVETLFGTYTAQYPSLGEENPLVSTDYSGGGEVYHVAKWDLSDVAVTMTEPEDAGGYYTAEATLVSGMQTARYTVTLENNPGSLCPYCVTGIAAE